MWVLAFCSYAQHGVLSLASKIFGLSICDSVGSKLVSKSSLAGFVCTTSWTGSHLDRKEFACPQLLLDFFMIITFEIIFNKFQSFLSKDNSIFRQNILQFSMLWSNELCHLQYICSSNSWSDGMTWLSKGLIKLFFDKIWKIWSYKVKLNVYLIFSSRFLCRDTFNAKQMNGSYF